MSEFESVLFRPGSDAAACAAEAPGYFEDLHLNDVLSALTTGREHYELAPLFHQRLHDVEAVLYRQHVMRDLERDPVLAAVRGFAADMRRMHDCLALGERVHYQRQKQRWFIEAIDTYGSAVTDFAARLTDLPISSPGLTAWREYLAAYVRSDAFGALVAGTRERLSDLADVRYSVHLKGNRVRVTRYQDEADMSREVQEVFAKFQEDAARDYRVRFREPADMNHVEARILDLVADLHPETFAAVDEFCTRHAQFVDARVRRFDREIQLLLAYIDHIAPLKARGLAFSYPRVSARAKHEHVLATFDLALAAKLVAEDRRVVTNDLQLDGPERILVVSGPNNGGKTTFARTFGQLHHLAALGLPVPGSDAHLFLADQIFTHFEREETIETLRGKFEDELHRVHEILEQATADSVLVMNETFGSTTLRDALLVGSEVVGQVISLDALCVFVTFVDELSALGESTVSMMSTVVADDPATRTYKIVRKPADGLAYAAAIAEKYGLTYETLRRRIAS